MRKFVLAATAAALALAGAGQARAARILYAYADTEGQAVLGIRDSFAQGSTNLTPLLCLASATTCAMGRLTQSSAAATYIPVNGTGSGSAYNFATNLRTPGTYTVTGGGVTAQFLIAELADTDVLYAYADTEGQAAVGLRSAFAQGSTNLTPLLCLASATTCTMGRLTQSSAAATYIPVNGTGSGSAYNFATNLRTPGTYTVTGGGVTAQLLIVGPLAAVPEPATWGLMLLGFGAVGAAARRRPDRATVSATTA